jgi:hypothetical protein
VGKERQIDSQSWYSNSQETPMNVTLEVYSTFEVLKDHVKKLIINVFIEIEMRQFSGLTSRIAMTESTCVGLYNMRTTRAPMSMEDILLPVKQSNSAKQNFHQIRKRKHQNTERERERNGGSI